MTHSIAWLVLSAAGGFAQTLATDYDAKRVLLIDAESSLEMRTTEFEVTRDGEPVGTGVGRDDKSLDLRRVVVRERVVETAGGAPTRVEREFQEVEGRAKRSIAGKVLDDALQCPLDGVELRLQRDGENVVIEVASGEELDPELLEGQRLELAADALLPGREVEEQATWQLANGNVRRLLGLDVEAALFPSEGIDPESSSGRRGRWSRGFAALSAAKWSGTATLASTAAQHEGERCARIDFDLSSSSELPGGGFGEPTDGGRSFEPSAASRGIARRATTFEAALSGYLLFSLEERRPVLLDVDGDIEVVTNSEREHEGVELRIFSRREGTFTHRVALSLEKDS